MTVQRRSKLAGDRSAGRPGEGGGAAGVLGLRTLDYSLLPPRQRIHWGSPWRRQLEEPSGVHVGRRCRRGEFQLLKVGVECRVVLSRVVGDLVAGAADAGVHGLGGFAVGAQFVEVLLDGGEVGGVGAVEAAAGALEADRARGSAGDVAGFSASTATERSS